MDQFNKDTYKRETLFQEFYHSCLGKIIILAAVVIILLIVGIITQPSQKRMFEESLNHVHQCLQDNDSTANDELDEVFNNIVRTFSTADTMLTKPETMAFYRKYNTMHVYDHTTYSTCYLYNTVHPQGVRIGIGIFGVVISTIDFTDLVLDVGPARGEFNEKLMPTPNVEESFGDNPHLVPYHYQGNPED